MLGITLGGVVWNLIYIRSIIWETYTENTRQSKGVPNVNTLSLKDCQKIAKVVKRLTTFVHHNTTFVTSQVPSAVEFFTFTCILSVNIHGSAQKITCCLYLGGPMCVPCTK